MNDRIIKGLEASYLSDVAELNGDLPDNCRFNKVITGCGGTTVALNNDVNYVICVPFISLIVSKMVWARENNKNVRDVYGEVMDHHLEAYTGNKWLCTYDSLHRVMKYIDPSEYKLLIDESHKLVDSGSFRGNAVRNVLDNYKKFKSFVFMTATPVPNDLQYEELVDLPMVRMDWEDIAPVTVKFVQLDRSPANLDKSLAKVCMEHLEGTRDGNAHLFVNSVSSIIKIVNLVKKLNSCAGADCINIIVANNPANTARIKKYTGQEIGSPSTPKTINLYTSTAFEGCDVYDEDGVVYVASYGDKDHSKINIITTLPQIIGRLRNQKEENSNTVFLLFTPNSYFSNLSEEEFKSQVLANLEEAKDFADMANSSKVKGQEKNVERFIAIGFADTYLVQVEEPNRILIANTQAVKSEIFNFRTIHSTYFVKKGQTKRNMNKLVNHREYDYTATDLDLDLTALDNLKLGYVGKYHELAEEYATKKTDNMTNIFKILEGSTDEDLLIIETEHPCIKQAYDVLGPDKMKALKYRKGAMKQAVIQASNSSLGVKVGKALNLKTGQWFSNKDIKALIQTAYQTVGVNETAKANDISAWYDVKPAQRRIDGKKVHGLVIVSKAFKVVK